MNLSATKLNATYSSLKAQLNKPSFDVDFWAGETVLALPLIVKKILPFSKVAILYTKASHEKYSKILTEKFSQNGNPVISLVMTDDITDSLDCYSKLFNLAEDVRLVVALDEKLFSLAKYFATIRQIECINVIRNLNSFGVLAPKITIRNKDFLEEVTISAKGHILLDYSAIESSNQSLSSAYSFIVSHTLALADYRVNALLTDKTVNKTAYQLASKSIVNAYSLFSNKREDFFGVITENLFNLEMANAFCDNALYQNFSANFAVQSQTQNYYASNLLLASTLIAKIYNLFCEGKYTNLLEYPNYLSRADYISKTLNLNHSFVNKAIVDNYNVLEQKRSKSTQYLKRMQKDIQSFINCSKIMENTFTVLGGNLSSLSDELVQMIKHSGDLRLNAMSLVRDSGITELI